MKYLMQRCELLLLFHYLLYSVADTALPPEDIIIKGIENGTVIFVTGEEILVSKLTTVFLPIVYIIVFVVGLPTNAVAIWVFIFRTKKKQPASIYMTGLALSDLLFVLWVPLKIEYHFKGNNWVHGEGLCKALVGFFYANMYCSIFFIMCLSLQRYWAIVHPMSVQVKNSQVAVGVSIAIWVVVWLTSIPLFLYDQTVAIPQLNIITCHDVILLRDKNISAGYFMFMGIFAFAIPSVVCVVAYVFMLRALNDSMTDKNIGQMRRKAVVLTIIVLFMFLLCFTPSNVMLFVFYILFLQDDVESAENAYGFYVSTLCLASLNSCVDPLIYYFVSEDFRDNVKNALICKSTREVERTRVRFSAMKNSNKSNTYGPGSAKARRSAK